jgi:sulfur-carrier protein
MIRVVFFARLREDLGTPMEEFHLPEHVRTVEDLRKHLSTRGEVWQQTLAPKRALRVAVNHEMAKADTPVRSGDEIAFFPPVTGG